MGGDLHPDMHRSMDSWQCSDDQLISLEKDFSKEPLDPSKTVKSECVTLNEKKQLVCGEESGITGKPSVFEEAFAEVCLDDEWLKVEVIKREGLSIGNYLVKRIDRSGSPFEVKA